MSDFADTPLSQRMVEQLQMTEEVARFFSASGWAKKANTAAIADMVLGNPQEIAVPGMINAITAAVTPKHDTWFAYAINVPEAQSAIASSLRRRRNIAVEERDIFVTNGGFSAIGSVLTTVVDQGDEVLLVSPPWPNYEPLIRNANATPKKIRSEPFTSALDLDAIAAAITPHTRAIIINTPHNPTGVIYKPETLAGLAGVLADGSRRIGRIIYLLSDEAYCRIVYDGAPFYSPLAYYPFSFLLYTYSKTLLAPGLRLGYIALPPTMPGRDTLRPALVQGMRMTGFAFASSILQHALPALEELSIDMAIFQARRDRLVTALRDYGYEVHPPEGTFYLLPRSPWADEVAFCQYLAAHNVFVLPGRLMECPGYFRISLTATDAMISQALPVFARAIKAA